MKLWEQSLDAMPVFVTVIVNWFSGVQRDVCVCVCICMCVSVCVCECVNKRKVLSTSLASLSLLLHHLYPLSLVPPPPPELCWGHTLVMEARQLEGFWSFSGWVLGGSGMARKLKGRPMWPEVPMWPGLSAGFCLLLLSTMLDVLEARLSRVLPPQDTRQHRCYQGKSRTLPAYCSVTKQSCYPRRDVKE